MAFAPTIIPAFVAGSPTGRMLSETIDICVNAKHMKEILLFITHLHHHNVTLTKNSRNSCSL